MNELLHLIQKTQEAKGEEFNAEEAQRMVDEFMDELSDDDAAEARQWLRDRGIESLEDWALIEDALRCIARDRPEILEKPGYKAWNRFVLKALELRDIARSKNCTPSEWTAWLKID